MLKKTIGKVRLNENIVMEENDAKQEVQVKHNFEKGTILPLVRNLLLGSDYVDFGEGYTWNRYENVKRVNCTILST